MHALLHVGQCWDLPAAELGASCSSQTTCKTNQHDQEHCVCLTARAAVKHEILPQLSIVIELHTA